MPGRYAVTDAGQRLFGDMTRTLNAFLQEKRAREERLNYRAEQKRRYDERMAMEREQIAQQQAKEQFDMQAQLAGLPAQGALELYPAAVQRRQALGGAGPQGTLAPRDVQTMVEGPPEMSMEPGGLRPTGLPTWLPQMQTIAPTDPGARALFERAGREQTQKEQARADNLRNLMAGIASRGGAPETALDIIGDWAEGVPVTTAEDIPRHKETMASEIEAREKRKDKRAADRRGGGAASLSALSSLSRAAYSQNNPKLYDKAMRGIEQILGPVQGLDTASVFAGKTREDRQQVARFQYSAVAPALKTEIADIQKELRTIAANPPSAQSRIARPAAEKALGEAKKELANLMRSAGLSPDRIELQRKAGPVPAEELAVLAESKALEWGVTPAEALKELQDMGYTPAETR